MSDQANQPNPGSQTRELNLQQMAEQFMGGIQRHLDMLSFNLSCREGVSEDAYKVHAKATRVQPAPPLHRNFEQIQAYSNDLLFCQVVNDALNLTASCLNNVHFFLSLVQANKEFGNLGQEAQEQAQQRQQTFVQAPFDQKFNRLEEEFGVMCELEDAMISLGFIMQALVQQAGIIKKPQLGEQGELEVELKVAHADAKPTDMWRQPSVFETVTKTFREDDKVEFAAGELQSILLTVAIFGHQLFTAVSKYAQENQPEG